MNNIIYRSISLLIIPIFVYSIFIAGKWGMADIYYQPEVIKFKKLRDKKIELTQEDWDISHSNLTKAMKLDPYNPYIHEYFALVLEGLAAVSNPQDKKADLYRQQALAHYKESIIFRPTWPHAWISLASSKYKLGQVDDEYYEALSKAEQFGSWELVVQKFIIDIGLHGWSDFSKENRAFTLEVISNAMQHSNIKHVINMLDVIRNRGYLNIVCLLHNDKDIVKNYCGRHIK